MGPHGSSNQGSNAEMSAVRAHMGASHQRCEDLPEMQVCPVGRAEESRQVETGPSERANARTDPSPVTLNRQRDGLFQWYSPSCLQSEAEMSKVKPRRKRIGKGIYRDGYGMSAVVKVGTGSAARQREKRFPSDTPFRDIKAWQEAIRSELRIASRRPAATARGTLSADAAVYLAQVKHLASYKSRVCEVDAWTTLYGDCAVYNSHPKTSARPAPGGSRRATRRRRATTGSRRFGTCSTCSTVHGPSHQ